MPTTMTSLSSTTTPFKPSLELQTKKSSARAFSSSLVDSTSDAAEARYWTEKFGLGTSSSTFSKKPALYAHPRKLTLQAGSSAIVHDLIFAPVDEKAAPLAVVCGPRVGLYGTTSQSTFHRSLARHSTSTATVSADRNIQTGGYPAICAAYRNDARLLAVGTDNGLVRVADTTTRATLSTFQSHLAVRSVAWFRDGQHLLCSGDDATLKVFKLGQDSPVLSLLQHGDAIRATCLWQDSISSAWPYRSLAATGSYDHTIRLWNMDNLDTNESETAERCLAVLDHGGPVEALLWMPSTNPNVPVWLLSAGGTTIKVWNPLTGLCVSTVDAQHRKTITCLLNMKRHHPEHKNLERILTAGLDGLIRVHSWDSQSGTIKLMHGIKLDVAITALGVNATSDRLAIGTASGTVMVRQIGPSITQTKRKREPRAGTYSFFTRGMNADPIAGDFVVGEGKKKKLKSFDLALKQFRYGDALDEALQTRIPQAVVAVLEELGKRRGLTIALSSRDEESLEPILSFTVRYISRPRFAALLIGVANKLIDIYGDVYGQSETIDELFAKLKNQVSLEAKTQRKLLYAVGQIEAIIAAIADEDAEED